MNDHRKSRLRQLATGVALVSASTLADIAPLPRPDPPYTNSPKPPPRPPKPPRVNSPPPQAPLDAGVAAPDPGPPVIVNSPGEQAPPPAVDGGTRLKKKL